jgi:Mg-chelatase subunit ChlD
MTSGRSALHAAGSLRCRIPTLLAISLVFSAAAVFPDNGLALDRNEIRFQRFLVGRHDSARLQAIRSVPRDFQSRMAALPIVVEALKTLSTDPIFDRAAKQGQPDLPDGVRVMIEFVGTVDRPEATESLIDLLGCGRPSWALASIQTLCKFQHQRAVEALVELMDSDLFESSYGFRFTLARGLTEMKHPDAWDALAKLSERTDGQLAHRLDQEFRKVTEDDFGGDVARFETWRKSIGLNPDPQAEQKDALSTAAVVLGAGDTTGNADLPLPKRVGLQPSQSAASYSRQRRLAPSNYYGIQIYAKRLVFVIDRSGSMRDIVAGQSRIQRAKRELITAISGLDEACEFGILVFDREVRVWRDHLVQATDSNKRNAIRFVEYLAAGSTTNTYAALRQALEFDDQLEAVFLLTDGEPTTGRIVNPSAILLDILRRNETHNVTINTIAIAVEPLMKTFLQNLAEPSEGEFREVR